MLPCVDDLVPIGEFSELSGMSPKRLRSYAAWAAFILPIVAAGTIVGLGVASQIR